MATAAITKPSRHLSKIGAKVFRTLSEALKRMRRGLERLQLKIRGVAVYYRLQGLRAATPEISAEVLRKPLLV